MIAMKWYYCVLAPSSALRADATREPRACYVAVSLHCAVQFVPFGYISSTMTLFRYIYLHSSTETWKSNPINLFSRKKINNPSNNRSTWSRYNAPSVHMVFYTFAASHARACVSSTPAPFQSRRTTTDAWRFSRRRRTQRSSACCLDHGRYRPAACPCNFAVWEKIPCTSEAAMAVLGSYRAASPLPGFRIGRLLHCIALVYSHTLGM
jgi:hypothetical protein